MAQGANASAAAATGIPPSFFYPYAAANFPGTNQPPGLYHTAAALFTAANPAVFTPFGPLAQLQAIQQHNQQVRGVFRPCFDRQNQIKLYLHM